MTGTVTPIKPPIAALVYPEPRSFVNKYPLQGKVTNAAYQAQQLQIEAMRVGGFNEGPRRRSVVRAITN